VPVLAVAVIVVAVAVRTATVVIAVIAVQAAVVVAGSVPARQGFGVHGHDLGNIIGEAGLDKKRLRTPLAADSLARQRVVERIRLVALGALGLDRHDEPSWDSQQLRLRIQRWL
jgi:hypothetical protein